MSLNWQDWKAPLHSSSEIMRTIAEDFEFSPDDIMISTFHKSGTTMMQHMVSSLMHGADLADSTPLVLRAPFIDFYLPSGESPLQEARTMQPPRILKTHQPPATHLRHLQQQQGPKNVIVMRNPKDVCVSAFHHFASHKRLSQLIPNSFSEYWKLAISNPVAVSHFDFFDFNLSWWSFKDHPRVRIFFYEDIVRNKEAALKDLAEFIGIEVSDSQLQRAAEVTSFKRMQENENVNFTLVHDPDAEWNPSFSFIRKGEIGGWKDVFTVEDNEMMDHIIAERMGNSDLKFTFE